MKKAAPLLLILVATFACAIVGQWPVTKNRYPNPEAIPPR